MSKVKYTEEMIQEAIKLKMQGVISEEITRITGIKKPSLQKIFKARGVKLTSEQIKINTARRWAGHDPVAMGLKICSACKLSLPLDNFHNSKNKISGLTSSCKQCCKAYYLNNSEKIKNRVKKYSKNNKDKIRESSHKYYENNKEKVLNNIQKWRSENPESVKRHVRDYGISNKNSKQARTALYRSNKKSATPPWLSAEQIKAIESIYKNRPEGFHVDHIVPIGGEDVCGLHVPWNLRYLPEIHNESKGNRLEDFSNVGVCHQYTVKLSTLEEDLAAGAIIEANLDKFELSQEVFNSDHEKFIKRYEWLGTVGFNVKWVFTARLNGNLAGLIIISEPSSYSIGPELEAQIQRGASASWAPKNLGSKLIMFACRWMVNNTSKRAFVGYSDPEAGEIGTIYQACNFDYLGAHFGGRTSYELSDGKKVSSKYFVRTSSMRKWAKNMGIQWEKSWNKENGFIDRKSIPKDTLLKLNSYAENEKKQAKLCKERPKRKYILLLGKDRRNQKEVDKIRTWSKIPYPKRSK